MASMVSVTAFSHGTTVRVDVPGGASVQVQADVILEVLGLREGRIGADMAVLVTIGLVLALAATVAAKHAQQSVQQAHAATMLATPRSSECAPGSVRARSKGGPPGQASAWEQPTSMARPQRGPVCTAPRPAAARPRWRVAADRAQSWTRGVRASSSLAARVEALLTRAALPTLCRSLQRSPSSARRASMSPPTLVWTVQ